MGIRDGIRNRNRQFQQTLRAMPVRSRILLAMAIFMTFASLALTGSGLSVSPSFWQRMVVAALFSGVVGVGYAAVGFGYRFMLPIVILLNVTGPSLINRWAPPVPARHALTVGDIEAIEERLRLVAAVRIGLAMAGYTCFVAVLRFEGRRSFGAYAEIRLAREIHAGLVPAVAGRSDGLQWYGVSRPSGDVGGDLVDVVAADAKWVGCLADVSGHGVAAGVLMGMFKTALRSAVRVAATPGEVLSQVNSVIGPLKQSNMFVTAAVLSWQTSGHLYYVLAGHPSLIHVPAATGQAHWVGESQIAVGFIEEVRYETSTLAIAPGDLVVVVTDGLLEIADRTRGELGTDGLRAIVEQAASAPTLAAVSDAIFAACGRHGAQADDQSLLLMRRGAAPAARPGLLADEHVHPQAERQCDTRIQIHKRLEH